MKRKTLDVIRTAARMPLFAIAVIVSAAAVIVATSSPSAAEETSPRAANRTRASEVGDATSAWLELQRSNQAAGPALPTLGAEAGLAYDRYLDSFKTKIPASFASPIETRGPSFGDYGNGGGSGAGASTNSN
ncbi:DUF3613 domain-containing protein [Trinickia symbiotica]|nr:DUF3613 domain-containing protein [Trinickia symbiotica]